MCLFRNKLDITKVEHERERNYNKGYRLHIFTVSCWKMNERKD